MPRYALPYLLAYGSISCSPVTGTASGQTSLTYAMDSNEGAASNRTSFSMTHGMHDIRILRISWPALAFASSHSKTFPYLVLTDVRNYNRATGVPRTGTPPGRPTSQARSADQLMLCLLLILSSISAISPEGPTLTPPPADHL